MRNELDRHQQKSENKEDTFCGSYGFVIKPDKKTQYRAENLAKELFPDAEFRSIIPHITLYHGRIIGADLNKINSILLNLRKYLGKSLKLNQIEIYGGKFAFWKNEINESLLSMHKESLEMAKYLDQSAVQRAVEEGLSLTEEELKNIKRYGHPLVGHLFRPHITLAYDSGGLLLPPTGLVEAWEMKIEDVHFAEMGKYGSVARVIDL